jgi:hypothetical protein
VILSITFMILYLKFIYILVGWLLIEEKLLLVSRINYLQGILTNPSSSLLSHSA